MTTTASRTVRRFAKTDFAAMLAVIGFIFALLCSKWAGASEVQEPRKGATVKCSIVYINGDAVITCPQGAR